MRVLLQNLAQQGPDSSLLCALQVPCPCCQNTWLGLPRSHCRHVQLRSSLAVSRIASLSFLTQAWLAVIIDHRHKVSDLNPHLLNVCIYGLLWAS